jgi:hypothetical protein
MYDQIDKHMRNEVRQCIINSELIGGHVLLYDEAFNEERDAFDKMKLSLFLVS